MRQSGIVLLHSGSQSDSGVTTEEVILSDHLLGIGHAKAWAILKEARTDGVSEGAGEHVQLWCGWGWEPWAGGVRG